MSSWYFFVPRRKRRKVKRRSKLPAYHKEARRILVARTRELANAYNFSVRKIFVKHQKTRWGSCSANNNINLNAKLIFLRQELRDYVIMHELCHLRHMNHSAQFWAEVTKYIPHAKAFQKELRLRPYHELKMEGLKEAKNFDTIRVVTYS